LRGPVAERGHGALSDTRTNAGLDNISTYRKMFTFEEPGERVIVIMTAGSLSVSQTTIAQLREAIDDPEATPDTSIMLAPTLLKVAEIVGDRWPRSAPRSTTSFPPCRAHRRR
jgi:putative proteasome-type protease